MEFIFKNFQSAEIAFSSSTLVNLACNNIIDTESPRKAIKKGA